jgi:hypothetical protein
MHAAEQCFFLLCVSPPSTVGRSRWKTPKTKIATSYHHHWPKTWIVHGLYSTTPLWWYYHVGVVDLYYMRNIGYLLLARQSLLLLQQYTHIIVIILLLYQLYNTTIYLLLLLSIEQRVNFLNLEIRDTRSVLIQDSFQIISHLQTTGSHKSISSTTFSNSSES